MGLYIHFHKWDKCVCTECGKTRHRWKRYDDVSSWGTHDDRKCKRCGKFDMDYTEQPPQLVSTDSDAASGERDNPSGYDGWGWPDEN